MYIAAVATILCVVAFVVFYRLFRSVKTLNNSFAKLGYVNREDAKKYFGEAADKVVDMNTGFNEQYQKLIEDAIKKAMLDSGAVMETTLIRAEQEAGAVVLKAQEHAQQILESAKKEATHFSDRAVGNAVDAISWSLEEYLRTDFSIGEHEDVIMKLLERYLNERRN